MKKDIKSLIAEMTLEEKASLCSGKDFWHLKGIERLNIPSIMVTDGPHGLRKQAGEGDHVGLNDSVPAVCFPTASATASSWDVNLMKAMGEALGKECLQEQVSVLLGPGANIKRSPLCGRNFEYISEDPYHTGEMAAAFINGVQSQGIGTSLKHYAVNNQEFRRMSIDAVVDERTLREIYLAGFEKAVKQAQPWTVMCAYNKVNGTFCSDHQKLLMDVLKEEWGHLGLVVTDWGACNNRVEGIKVGMELEMPSSGGLNDEKIVDAVKEGNLDEAKLDQAVERILELISKAESNKRDNYKYDVDAHIKLAKKAAVESAVLFKNDDNILPLNKKMKIAVIGEFAKTPRYQGSGSSLINPIRLDSAYDALIEQGIDFDYYKGYNIKSDLPDSTLISEAKEGVTKADCVVIFAGLTNDYESEGFDRTHMNMPESHNELIKQVAKVNSNVIVMLQNGAPVTIPWHGQIKGILECYLGGQAGGSAVVDILFGKSNPSGKLAETFPIKLEENPSYQWFPMGPKTIEYREGIYVGYRYYDKAQKSVLYPFGHGLSYTTFKYSDLKLSSDHIQENEGLEVHVSIENTGDVYGGEIVQLYVSDIESTIFRPEKELKAFKKVWLHPGEKKTITFKLDQRSFAYYNINIKDWHVETGEFKILVGASSRDIRLESNIHVTSENESVVVPDYHDTAPDYYNLSNVEMKIKDESFEQVLGRSLPGNNPDKTYNLNSTLGDVKNTFIGKKVYEEVCKKFKEMISSDSEDTATNLMMEHMIDEMPLRSLVLMSNGDFSFDKVEGLLLMMNKKPIRGLFKLLKK